jgi:hypothetical protein
LVFVSGSALLGVSRWGCWSHTTSTKQQDNQLRVRKIYTRETTYASVDECFDDAFDDAASSVSDDDEFERECEAAGADLGACCAVVV